MARNYSTILHRLHRRPAGGPHILSSASCTVPSRRFGPVVASVARDRPRVANGPEISPLFQVGGYVQKAEVVIMDFASGLWGGQGLARCPGRGLRAAAGL